MLSTTARESRGAMDTQVIDRNMVNAVGRKIWLPKILYDSLPFFYLASGILAFFATLYVSAWFWIVPHYLLFSAACLHLGFVLLRRRSSSRHARSSQG